MHPEFEALLAKHAKVSALEPEDVLFGSGLNLSSIRFTEFIMELEEALNIDIDIDELDASIVSVGQLHDRLAANWS